MEHRKTTKKAEPVSAPIPKRPARPPFNCGYERLMALAGDIIYSGANEYKLAGYAIKRAEQAKKLGYFEVEMADDERYEAAMAAYRRAVELYPIELKRYEEAMAEYTAERRLYKALMEDYEMAVREWESLPPRIRLGRPQPPRVKEPRRPNLQRPVEPVKPVYVASANRRLPTFREIVREKRSIMARERAFILSDTFQILLGDSENTGQNVLVMLDRAIDQYDQTPYVPEIDPETGKPFTKKQWKRILQERNQYDEKYGKKEYLRKKAPKKCGILHK